MAVLGVLLNFATLVPLDAQTPWLPGSTSALHYNPVLPEAQSNPNATGSLGTVNVNGPTFAPGNPFFQSLGTNGRTCATCHQPENSMSISAASVQQRYLRSWAQDPLFAPIDGANCPDAPITPFPDAIGDPNNPRSLLLNRALIRIGLPWPPKGVTPEFQILGVYDPTHCELDKTYGLLSPNPTVSVYRRSLMASNLKFVTTVGPGAAPPGVTLPIDPTTGLPESGNIMYDGREATLMSQAADAIMTHTQAVSLPSSAVIQQIVNFENGIYSAQAFDFQAQCLTDMGAYGGPGGLPSLTPGLSAAPDTFSEYSSWSNLPFYARARAQRESVARGEAIFNSRTFTVSNVAGINDIFGGNVVGTCTLCHANTNDGNDVHPQAELNEGTTGGQFALNAPDLPYFLLACNAGKTTPFEGSVVWVRDPGKALITGKCADIGKVKSAQLRGLAARAPYFHDGTAAGLGDVVDFYDARFSINFSATERQDLINFLGTL